MLTLPETSNKPAIFYDYFPTRWQAVLFRNWNRIPLARMAKVLETTEEILLEEARRLRLPAAQEVSSRWDERGFLTIIRENWHLLPYEQLTALLQITPEYLAFILKEDDFMWHKMGRIKPFVEKTVYAPLKEEEKKRTEEIAQKLLSDLGGEHAPENAFAFCDRLLSPLTEEEKAEAKKKIIPGDQLRTIYSYFALYGDPLLNPELDPFPERLLSEYAAMGVKGVWLQGILYQLVPFPFAPEKSEGHEKRMESLRALVKRAAEYDIGVYIYLNEPRAMDNAFFEKYPHLRGVREDDFYSMCTSQPEVKEYLESAMERLFREAEGLAGFFTITKSENLTNCISRSAAEGPCPRCAKRDPWEIIAEVNNLMARGAKKGNPKAKAIAWNWAWDDAWATKVAPLLTEGQIVQCTSEERMPTCIGGVEGYVIDYTMSLAGPGEKAKRVWKSALESGHETCAKVQVNNTWEASPLPYLPVFDRVEAHMKNLREAGVSHLQLSWTLGGYPSPNLKLASQIMSGETDVKAFLCNWLGEEDGMIAYEAQKKMSAAFTEFPFHVDILYKAPPNYGPMAPFFAKPSGWPATMTGFPYDDLNAWRGIYPVEILENQMALLVKGWREGAALLAPIEEKSEELSELSRMAQAALCHFESFLNHIRFVRSRNAYLETGEDCQKETMLSAIREERATVQRLIKLRAVDSRLGFEASNHYFYTMNDLEEKLINLRYCEEQL